MAFRNLFKSDLALVTTNLAVVFGVATLLGNAAFQIHTILANTLNPCGRL